MKTWLTELSGEPLSILEADLFLNLVVALFVLVGEDAAPGVLARAASRTAAPEATAPLALFLAGPTVVRVGSPQGPVKSLAELGQFLTNAPAKIVLHHPAEVPAAHVFHALQALQDAAPQAATALALNPSSPNAPPTASNSRSPKGAAPLKLQP